MITLRCSTTALDWMNGTTSNRLFLPLVRALIPNHECCRVEPAGGRAGFFTQPWIGKMFVKLYSRITESSLMEQPIEVRYTFMMLLAIADPTGRVVGTDIAIARRINLPLLTFVNSVNSLKEPDPDSNSKEEEGRRVISSDGERGYQIVNYQKYRNLKDENEKREYMRTYMRNRRDAVKNSNSGKEMLNVLDDVTQAEAEGEAKELGVGKPTKPEKPKRKPRAVFTVPTVEEVSAYCQERGNSIDPQRFVDHYTSNGWVVGKTKMKDWRAAVRTWEKNDVQRNGKPQPPKPMTRAEIDAIAQKMNEDARREAHNPELENETR